MHDDIRDLFEQLQAALNAFHVDQAEDLGDLEIKVTLLKEQIHPATSASIAVLIDDDQPGLGDAILFYVQQSERMLGPDFERSEFEPLRALRSRGEKLKADQRVASMRAIEQEGEPANEPAEKGDPVAAAFAHFGVTPPDGARPDALLLELDKLIEDAPETTWSPAVKATLIDARAVLFERHHGVVSS